jgi:hypothetical protein
MNLKQPAEAFVPRGDWRVSSKEHGMMFKIAQEYPGPLGDLIPSRFEPYCPKRRLAPVLKCRT